mmetsp:Transcript_12576/g.17432  ORF Transcript_12576/g.17432 Transcript_12576/m.17432 type:complete len:136 (+) Transcript_12576:1138-1545(+)
MESNTRCSSAILAAMSPHTIASIITTVPGVTSSRQKRSISLVPDPKSAPLGFLIQRISLPVTGATRIELTLSSSVVWLVKREFLTPELPIQATPMDINFEQNCIKHRERLKSEKKSKGSLVGLKIKDMNLDHTRT